jgi:hypothetical protein
MTIRTLTPAGKFWLSYLAMIATATFVACTPAPAAAQTVGLHIGSAHIPASDHLNNVNPGAYVRYDSGATAGFYRNSYKRLSVYAGWTWERGPFALTVGGITGYKRSDVPCTGDRLAKGYTHCWDGSRSTALSLLVAPSVALPDVFGITPRVTVLPKIESKGSTVIHLAVERAF